MHYYDEIDLLKPAAVGANGYRYAVLAPLLEGHRQWVAGMWGKPCPPQAYAGLADLYESHPDFRSRYETLTPGLADYLPTAMRAYSRSLSR